MSSSVTCLGEKLMPDLFLPLVKFPLHPDAVPKSSSETLLWDMFCTPGSARLGRWCGACLYLWVGATRGTQTHVQRDAYEPPERTDRNSLAPSRTVGGLERIWGSQRGGRVWILLPSATEQTLSFLSTSAYCQVCFGGSSRNRLNKWMMKSESRSVTSDSLWPHGVYSAWSSPGRSTGVGSRSLLQGLLPTQGWTRVSCVAGGFFSSWCYLLNQGSGRKHVPSVSSHFAGGSELGNALCCGSRYSKTAPICAGRFVFCLLGRF